MDDLVLKHIVLTPAYPQNTQEFKDLWVNEYVDWFRNNATYHSVFLEHEETNCHLDVNVWIPKSKDFTNWARKFKEINKKFLEANPASSYSNFYRVSKIPDTIEDTLYLIGYNIKEGKGVSNVPADLSLRGQEYYEEHKKTKKTRTFMNTNALTVKNVVCYMLEQSQDLGEKEPIQLIPKMIKKGFSFVPLSKNHMRKAVLEFKIRTGLLDLDQPSISQEEYELSLINGCHQQDDYSHCAEQLDRIRDIIRQKPGSWCENDSQKLSEISNILNTFYS